MGITIVFTTAYLMGFLSVIVCVVLVRGASINLSTALPPAVFFSDEA